MNYKNNKILTGIIILCLLVFLGFFFFYDAFFTWAFARHQNTLSWFIRPIMILPFCYFAYTKNLNGMLLSILALFTSMFWFPVPAEIDPKVIEFLEMEKLYLKGEMNFAKLSGFAMVIVYFALLWKALWHRSIKLGALVIVGGMLIKIVWSILASPEAGASIIPFALGGTIICGAGIAIYLYYKKKC